MFAPVTQIYVAAQTARELVVVDPPYTLVGVILTACGVLALLVGYVVLFLVRPYVSRPIPVLMWCIPLLVGAPLLAFGLGIGTGVTRLTISKDAGTLSVRKTILALPVHSRQYPLSQVREVRVGVGDVCRFLYVSLVDGQSESISGCTDRTGYSEVADSMNEFIETNRR